jgi:hypothetical protein
MENKPSGQKELKYILVIASLLVIIALLFFKKNNSTEINEPENKPSVTHGPTRNNKRVSDKNIEQLTKENIVVAYVKEHGKLPGYYITKKKARLQGWDAGKGNLCDVIPGKAIGGDVFTNRDRQLPTKKGRTWYEADLNYDCGRRNADRLLFSNDGLLFVTRDHYKTFDEK